LLDAIVRPGQYRHRTLSFATRRPVIGQRCDANRLKKSLPAESLNPRRARKSARTFTQNTDDLRGVIPTARDVVSDN
jgi:hypothetical protein